MYSHGFRGVYGTAFGGDQLGAPHKELAEYVYGHTATYGAYGGKVAPATFPQRRRINIVAVGLSLFTPWLTFLLTFALLSFNLHYNVPALVNVLVALTGVLVSVACVVAGVQLYRAQAGDAEAKEEPSWAFFIAATALVAFAVGTALGNRNYAGNMRPYYDLTGLNTYAGVDPARMRGQELMDAGQVTFVEGSHLDFTRAMAFKNQDTYCVVPITGGSVEGNPPLASYDFFAVGKNCCPGSKFSFQCDQYNIRTARSGVRLVRQEDRSFYRLAVQQAQSAYGIRAAHPLFFHWVMDPVKATADYRRDGFKWFLSGMVGYFALQLLLVYSATYYFSKLG